MDGVMKVPDREATQLEPDKNETKISLADKIISLVFIIGPLMGFCGAMFTLRRGISLADLSLLMAFYLIRGFGITVGYHRYFTHQAFTATPLVQFLLGISGSMAIQGTIRDWCGRHSDHHKYSDKPGQDSHTPWEFGQGKWDLIKGFFHAHVGWISKTPPPPPNACTIRLEANAIVRFVDRWVILWGFLGMAIPAISGGLVSQSWRGALTGFLWGGPACIFLVHQVTWGVNSYCHIFGKRHYKTPDHSGNSFFWSLISLGEGNHNFHHAFPSASRNGEHWWQIDASWLFIWLLHKSRLVSSPRLPTRAEIDRKKVVAIK